MSGASGCGDWSKSLRAAPVGDNAYMSNPPFSPGAGGGALRGAVDLSSLGHTPPPSSGGAPAGPSGGGLRVDGTEADFQELVLGTRDVAALFVLWSAAHPESEQAVEQAVAAASTVEGRLRVVAVDVDANPGIASAFQAQQIPMTVGVIAGQPVPLFAGVQPAPSLAPVINEILNVAAQNGVTGRIDGAAAEPENAEPALPPLHQEAFDAIERGDFAAAREAYSKALEANPSDTDASAGLAQVGLLERLGTVDMTHARKAAADAPDDVDAQLTVADLDVAGGHVEDAFARLVDLVRRTADEERDRVRTHLLELFEVVGTHDPRVTKARRALMSALF